VIVNGEMNGDIHCSKHLELAARALVKGNIYYSFLEVVKGARVNGKMTHQEVVAGKPEKNTVKETTQNPG
jgi:cytoskeletal protein CcmA (bactofilin family)